MARPDKVAVVDDVKARLEGAAATLLTDYRGLSVGELAELRAKLREANATYVVAKNTLAKIAANEAGIDGFDEYLVGPTAWVFCEEGPVDAAKALKAFSKDHPELEIKAGLLDGAILDAEATLKLADLESRSDLLERFAGLMYGALANTARLLNALPEKQARLLAAFIEDGGNPDVADAPAPAADTTEAPADEAPAEDAPANEAPDVEDAAGEPIPSDEAPEDAVEVDAPATPDEAVAADVPDTSEAPEAEDTDDEPTAPAAAAEEVADDPEVEAASDEDAPENT